MSKVSEKSPKHCGEKTEKTEAPNTRKHLLYIFLSLLLFIFLVWLILHPSKPRFSLQQLQINLLNLTQPSLLNTSILLTLQSDNPNQRVGIYYDDFLIYASYRNQKITPDASVSPFYQGQGETNTLSTSLVGYQQPVSPSLGYQLERDQGIGKLVVGVKGMGRLRWKVGSWISGRYRFVVSCITDMPFEDASAQQGSQCSTTL
ncbi:hypothetical protein M569_07563 [Genlisea aurea]|uniref:Late embryogenesis abundant protein LEA-2 subgroup domain-containing protein n=1 Tax=Genlisea aurea TaxID=192259 RepID=S8E4H0_9LAMI|nr:hypothetical protein M569_07563 [Genlisea aurea]